MTRRTLLAIILLTPGLALGATLEGSRTLQLTEGTSENAYLVGANVSVYAPVGADLSAAGGTVLVEAPISGDALVAGGTVELLRPVGGDVRAMGGRVSVRESVAGDLSAVGGVVTSAGRAQDIQIVGGDVRVTGGADGTVTVYGGHVHLGGEFLGNVSISASDRITIAENTLIHGALRYNASQELVIPETAQVLGGATYTGGAQYLPSFEEAQRYALAGASVFFLAKALAALVASGLVVGLFPALARSMVGRMFVRESRTLATHTLLGLALVVGTPILLVLLVVSFVGIGIAFLLSAVYVLALLLSYVYAGLLVGVAAFYLVTKRITPTWKAAVLGTFLLHVIGLVPLLGGVAVFALMLLALGALARAAYRFSFVRTAV